ncbi:MAG: hypothetical protein L0211_21930 [Planctomycetaceae bacterium]|nr:hypothetical protein [Planctomycetaceae bacterium]
MTAHKPLFARAWRAGPLRWPAIKPLRDLPLLTIVLLLTAAPEQWYLRAPLIAMFALGVVFRSWLVRPQFWYIVATLLGATVYMTWESSDNHKYLFVYWCLALCCAFSLPRQEQHGALALASRWLIGLCMLLATVWKLATPEYLDGSFFHYECLCDPRLAPLVSWLTGMSSEVLAANRDLRELMHSGYVRGLTIDAVALTDSPRLWWLAQRMTWWTVAIEGTLAVLFLWPDKPRISTVRNAALLFFAATTYFVAPVRGFGWMLMLLGMGQCKSDERGWRLAYLAALVLIQAYTLPVGAILEMIAK